MTKPIILVVGTRAEAIKLIPVYQELKQQKIPALLCATFQHSDLLEQVFSIFGVRPDFNLNIMKHDQDLFYLTQIVLEKMRDVYRQTEPSLVIVHGDTTTTMAAALAAFYLHIPIGHVEAGLRTGNMQAPFPEEMNRKVVGQIADYHFAPTAFSTANLLNEGVPREHVYCTGNTIVDALFSIQAKIAAGTITVSSHVQDIVAQCKRENKKMVLLTAHRRESFGGGLERVFNATKTFAQRHDDVCVLYPYHPNPNVLKAIDTTGIGAEPNIWMTKPLEYADLVYLLSAVDWVATDSGGIQEEAVSIGRRVLVLRDITERWEGIWEGSEILVGTDQALFLKKMEELYAQSHQKIKPSSVYGDGNASKVITTILKNEIDRKGFAIRGAQKELVGKVMSA